MLEVGPAGVADAEEAQNHHACTVPVSKREHATSLVLPSKQNLYNCICEKQ